MIDQLTEHLRVVTQRMPGAQRPPADVRRAAGRRRRHRRAVGGVVAGAVALAVTLGSVLLGGVWTAPAPLPAATPLVPAPKVTDDATSSSYQLGLARDANVVVVVESTGWGDRTGRTLELALQRAVPSESGRCGDLSLADCPAGTVSRPRARTVPARLALAADPLLTDADWKRLTGGGRVLVVRTEAALPRLTDCVEDPRGLGARETRASSYTQPEPAQSARALNEYVLGYADVRAAEAGFAQLRDQMLACPRRALLMSDEPLPDGVMDQMFVAEHL